MATLKSFKEHAKKVTLKSTIEFIKQAHDGQMYGAKPYWLHPMKVLETGKHFFGSKFTPKAQMIALLHDVIEDTPHGEQELLDMGYPKDVVTAVKLLSKDKTIDYMSNIRRIIASGNKNAMMVKFADNYENYTGTKSGGKWTPEKIKHSTAKYKESIDLLAKSLGLPESTLTVVHKEIEKRYANL